MRFLLLLLLSTVTFGQSIPEQVKKFQDAKRYSVEYDKFQKEHIIHVDCDLKPTKTSGVQSMIWAILGEDNSRTYALYFSAQRTLYNQPTLRLLIDGELVEVKDDDIDYSVMISIEPDLFNRIAKAKTVEVQISSFEGIVTEKCMTAFRNIVSLTKPPPR